MGWNKPVEQPKVEPKKPTALRGLIAGGIVVLAAVVTAVFIFFCGDDAPKAKTEKSGVLARLSDVEKPKAKTKAERIGKIKAELNEQVKPFVKQAPTNKIDWVVKPLDPDDPDNALRTRTMTEVAMLIGIKPGDPLPPVPFSFMLDDLKMRSAVKRGEKLLTMDGGNARFKEELVKWKITIKDSDDEARIAKKQELLSSQLDLLDGIDQGVSVNDSIRAAYEFRKEAYSKRKDLLKTLRELHQADPDNETTRALVDKANEKLSSEGIKTIPYRSVMPDCENKENSK